MADAALLSPQDPAWTEALDRVRHDIYHIPEYVRLDAGLTGGTPVAYRYDEAGRVFLLPLLLRPVPDTDLQDAISPYGYPGPVGSDDAAFWSRAAGTMTELLCTEGVVTAFARLHPLLPGHSEALAVAGTLVNHGETVSIDLTLSPDELWSQTHRSHRNQIGKATRAGVEITFDDWSRFDEWIDTYHATMRRVGATAFYFFSAAHFHRLRTALADHVHLAVATLDGEVLGGNLFFEYAGTMHTHLQSTADAPIHYADKLLYHAVRMWGRDRGNTVYHLGGGVGGSADSLFRYKSQFGSGRQDFHTWRVITDPCNFEKLAGPATADSLMGRFPPYR
ncbi:GNAT family N-acetyltransferase [Actinoplanes bogorensis]|uniref:GNAT family N-acetyltransferase n=1 Tax=Paractinoplanes bogorensis TaxID=1610840 RepID=A0ABS5YTN3_9ACTN|nr:GNAT family N-acetyltransferase [Actinoplanes bogorensis]MBU2666821.1 GNAT family N-acetyltransferase [Actinoplanes bogorensis]